MTTWRQPYKAGLSKNAQRPVYLFIITQSYAQGYTFLGGGDGSGATTLIYSSNDPLEAFPDQDVILWNNDRWEMFKVDGVDTFYNYINVLNGRGAYGTGGGASIGLPIDEGVTMASIGGAYCTHTLGADADGFSYFPGSMQFPQGGGVMIDTLNGRADFSDTSVTIADTDGKVANLFKTSPIIGERGILLAGYDGMDLANFEIVWTGRIATAKFRDGIAVDLTVESIIHKMEKKLFEHIDVFNDSGSTITGWTTGYAEVSAGTGKYIPTSDDVLRHDDPRGATYDGYAAYHLKADDEWARITLHSAGADGMLASHPALGSEDFILTHANTAATLAFVVEDNPIDILLGLLFTHDNEKPMSVAGGGDGIRYSYYQVGAEPTFSSDPSPELLGAGGPLGLGFHEAEVDLPAIEKIRDDYFKRDVCRVVFDSSENMRPWLEKHFFKPKNLNYIVTRTGKLSVTTLMPPVGEAIETLAEDEIIGVPIQEMDNTEVINDVTVKWNYEGGDYTGTPYRQIDETSQDDYEQQGNVTLEDRTAYDGGTLPRDGELIARYSAKRKYRNRRKPHPTVTINVPMTKAGIEVGRILDVTHSKMVDTIKGERGWADKRVAVVGRIPRWARGFIELDVIETVYTDRNYARIAPAGTADWTSATDDEKEKYAFVSSTTNDAEGAMSDGVRGYHVV